MSRSDLSSAPPVHGHSNPWPLNSSSVPFRRRPQVQPDSVGIPREREDHLFTRAVPSEYAGADPKTYEKHLPHPTMQQVDLIFTGSLPRMQDIPDVFFHFESRRHHLVTASHTAKPQICTGTQDQPALLSARMGLFQGQDIPYSYLHSTS